jgi:dienelactone hydrolase
MVTHVELGARLVACMVDDQFDDVSQMLSPELREQLPTDQLIQGWRAMREAYGEIREFGTTTSNPTGPDSAVVATPVRCERGEFTVHAAIDGNSFVTGLLLRQTQHDSADQWVAPDYADSARLLESNTTIVAQTLPVEGVLTLPRQQPRPVPGVVMIPGSGPMDRDGTIGPNKPMRDVAWGLATHGVATLRYDKVTRSHPQHFAGRTEVTLDDEYVAHAVAAVEQLRSHPSIDSRQVYLLGHSQGGTIAPRVVANTPGLAGLIVMAGATQPAHHAALRQIRYLVGLNPEADVNTDPEVTKFAQQVNNIDAADFSSSTPASELPFGVPASYWLDLLNYDPVATAAQLRIRMFILQGGRDYQVTLSDDFTNWETGLGDRTDVQLRMYAADDHQFFSGVGPSTPQLYQKPQHVDSAVVTDIATWIAGGST